MSDITSYTHRLRQYASGIENSDPTASLMLKTIAYGIEDEVDMNYIERQKDAEGQPIYIGQRMVAISGEPSRRGGFTVAAIGACVVVDDMGNFYPTRSVREHVEPTLDDLLDELDHMWPEHFDACSISERCREISKRIREIVEEREKGND